MIYAEILLLAGGMIDLPPLKFEHGYFGKLIVEVMPEAAIHARCHGINNAHYRIMACAVPENGRCTIIIPEVERGLISEAEQERLRLHEIGHCNGWRGSHKGGRFNDFAIPK